MKTDKFIQWLIGHGAKYQVRYIDYPEGHFTIPVQLTKDRADILFDHSIIEIRFLM